jgi:DNA-binding XRE family transcriptional regulator
VYPNCIYFVTIRFVSLEHIVTEEGMAALAMRFREQAGKKRAQAARDMGVAQTSIFHAEESPKQSLFKLRVRMIEAYSPYHVIGPVYHLKKK